MGASLHMPHVHPSGLFAGARRETHKRASSVVASCSYATPVIIHSIGRTSEMTQRNDPTYPSPRGLAKVCCSLTDGDGQVEEATLRQGSRRRQRNHHLDVGA